MPYISPLLAYNYNFPIRMIYLSSYWFREIVNDSNQSMLPSIFAFNLKHSLHTIKMITMTFVKRSFLWNHKIYFFMVCSNEEHLLGIVWMLCSCAIYALILLLNARSLPWQLLLLLKYTLWFTM